MPVSKKRKKKNRSSGGRGGSNRPGYRPGVLEDDTAPGVERLLTFPAHALPSIGLAEFYLMASPARNANQCGAATVALVEAAHALGLGAEGIALTLDVNDRHGGLKRYGSLEPKVQAGQIIGHVGALIDGMLIDATGTQFPEVRRLAGASRPISVQIGHERVEQARVAGGMVGVRMHGEVLQYTLLPGVGEPLLEQVHSLNSDLIRWTHEFLVPNFCRSLAMDGFFEEVLTLTDQRYEQFVSMVEVARD